MTSPIFSLDDALGRLKRISAAIDALQFGDYSSVWDTLRMILENTLRLLPASSLAIELYDPLLADEFTPQDQTLDGAAILDFHPRGLEHRAEEGGSGPQIGVERTAARFPLTSAGELLGAFSVTRPARPFCETELALLEHVASLAGMALSQAHQAALAQQDQARRQRELRRLRRAGMLISSRTSLKDTLDAILKMALEVTDASYGIFRLVEPHNNGSLVTHTYAGIDLARPATEALPITENSVMGTVALKREPVVISDLREEPWRAIYYPFDHALEMRSEIAVPLIGASGRLEGVLNLESPEVNAFNREDQYILQILATQAVVAIQEIRLLDALQEISSLLYTRSLQQVHQTLVERACDLLNVPASFISLLDKDQLVVHAASDPALAGRRMPLAGSLIGQVILSGQPLAWLSAQGQPFGLPEPDGFPGEGSLLAVPLFTSDGAGAVGVFAVQAPGGEQRDFSQSDWDKKVLTILGHYAALAVQNEAHLEALKFAEDQRATTETFAAIGDIAANLLHRLNNKVGTIPVRVEGIQDKCEAVLQGDPYLADNLAEIQRSATDAMQVVRESLDHLRPIQLAPVSVAASLQEALAAVKLLPGVRVECQGLEALPPVQAGANRLALVFGNLLENAADAMENQGRLLIRGSVQGEWVEVRIGDTGPGIPHSALERIFDFSYSSRASAHPGKLGFGLWWVKSLMTRFGGKVAVEDTGPQGTTFLLSFPLSRGEP